MPSIHVPDRREKNINGVFKSTQFNFFISVLCLMKVNVLVFSIISFLLMTADQNTANAKSVLVQQGSAIAQGTIVKLEFEAESNSICHVITVAHAINDDDATIKLIDQNGNFELAEAVFVDEELDLALLRLNNSRGSSGSVVCGKFYNSQITILSQVFPFEKPTLPFWIDKVTSEAGGLERVFFEESMIDTDSRFFFGANSHDEVQVLQGYSGAGAYSAGPEPDQFFRNKLSGAEGIKHRDSQPEGSVGVFTGMLIGREGDRIRFLSGEAIYQRVLNHFDNLDWDNINILPKDFDVLVKRRGLPYLGRKPVKFAKGEASTFWGLYHSTTTRNTHPEEKNDSLILLLDLGDEDHLVSGIRVTYESKIHEARKGKYNRFSGSKALRGSTLVRLHKEIFGSRGRGSGARSGIFVHQFRPEGSEIYLPKTADRHLSSRCLELNRSGVEKADDSIGRGGISVKVDSYSATCIFENPKVARGISLRLFGDVGGLRQIEILETAS